MGKVLKDGNFNYEEWLVSESYPDIISGVKLTDQLMEIIKLQVQALEQPLRNRFGRAKIVSGFRTVNLNLKVGGSPDSDHLTGNATDVVYLDVEDQMEVFKHIVNYDFHYRQVIIYPQANRPFIHKSINIPGKPYKNEAFIYRDGIYYPWKGEKL